MFKRRQNRSQRQILWLQGPTAIQQFCTLKMLQLLFIEKLLNERPLLLLDDIFFGAG